MSVAHLPERVRQHAAGRPFAPAITCGDTTVTYHEFDQHTNRIATGLASYKRPQCIHFVDALPRNASGKVLKRALRGELSGSEVAS